MAGTYTRGRYASVRFGTDTINLLGNWEVAITFDEIDASVFGTTWKRNLTGMSGWTATVGGFINASTTNATLDQLGSSGVFKSALNGTAVQDIRFFLQTSSGMFWMPAFSTANASSNPDAACYLSNIRNSIDKAGLGTLSFSAVGYGPIALFKTGTSDVVVESTG